MRMCGSTIADDPKHQLTRCKMTSNRFQRVIVSDSSSTRLHIMLQYIAYKYSPRLSSSRAATHLATHSATDRTHEYLLRSRIARMHLARRERLFADRTPTQRYRKSGMNGVWHVSFSFQVIYPVMSGCPGTVCHHMLTICSSIPTEIRVNPVGFRLG